MILSARKHKTELNRKGPEFIMGKGAKQGNPVSSNLFNFLLEGVCNNEELGNWGMKIDGKRLSNLRFADNYGLVITLKNFKWWQKAVERLFRSRLEANLAKTKKICINAAWKILWSLRKIYKSKFGITSKVRILENCTLPALSYSTQTQTVTRFQVDKLKATQRKRKEKSYIKKGRVD